MIEQHGKEQEFGGMTMIEKRGKEQEFCGI